MMTHIDTPALQLTEAQRANESREFRVQLVSSLPRLCKFARALTRNTDQADDLINDTMVRALRAEDQFQIGTNMIAWLCTILRNQHISNVRQSRPTMSVDDLTVGAPTISGGQFAAVELGEVAA